MGDFNNQDIGGGLVKIDGVDIGFTDGDITCKRKVELKISEDGIPLQRVGQVPLKEEWEIVIPAVEVITDNISKFSLNIPFTEGPAAEVEVTDAANQEKTFANYPTATSPFQAIVLDGGDLTAASFALENVAESTTYVAGTDYYIDEVLGICWRLPGGAITAGATVRPKYKWNRKQWKKLHFGKPSPVTFHTIEIIHTNPINLNTKTYYFRRCQSDGELDLTLYKKEFWKLTGKFNAFPSPDPAHVDTPTGYYLEEIAA